MPPKQVYSKKDQIDHLLLRPDTYVGSKREKYQEEYISEKVENDIFKIVKKKINFSPAILRIFVEILSNSIDNVKRSKDMKIPCTTIKVSINKETGETSIWNDGAVVPIEIHEKENIYNHTLIFGYLLSGSNFDDTEERFVSGRNGIGASATNVFSRKFKVSGLDPDNCKTFEQTWENNMRKVNDPIVKPTKLKKGYTHVTYFPDFEQFGIKGYTDDIINLYLKYVIDASMLSKVKVYFNEELINVPNILEYSKLYNRVIIDDDDDNNNNSNESILIKNSHSEVVITTSNGEFQAISFVNGVYTKAGGVHVDAFSEAIFRPIVEKFTKKNRPSINIKDVKQFFRIFVNSLVVNPEFSSQDKERLEFPKIEAVVKSTDINKILKWSVISDIENLIKGKELLVLKKTEKKKNYVKIEGLDNANFAGTKRSSECSLILCEGLSAKTYGIAGIQKGIEGVSGRDFYGVLALRGKVLNCRNSNPTTISKNKVITDLIQAIGLKYDVDYTIEENFKNLSYGKVVLLCDADCDGLHISSLIINFFHALFPTLLKREIPFLINMLTPIVRVFKAGGDQLFYDENLFRQFEKEQIRKFKCKYYKGLGTIKPEDVNDTFGVKMMKYINDEDTDKIINKVFHKNFSDDRKLWLETYDPNPSYSKDDGGIFLDMKISTYLDKELIKFSISDCKRSIPTLFDGLKCSQRKILYGLKKRNLTFDKQSVKVAQLGGYIAEHTSYHHGEQNLYDTIVNMSQDFVGSNNIPYFYRDGMFGTRISNGKDSASPRYIYTKMEKLTPLLFRPEDDILLDYIIEEGDTIEPNFYIPILPMILINGCLGIGTGFSTNIPAYNPIDVIDAVRIWIENDGEVLMIDPDDQSMVSLLPELMPWYRGFKGTIERNGENKYVTKGVIEKDKKGDILIKELPIGKSIDSFKEYLEDFLVMMSICYNHNLIFLKNQEDFLVIMLIHYYDTIILLKN